MKHHILRLLAVLLAIGWMTLIFGFSSQSGDESGGLSALIARPVTDVIAAWQGIEDTEALYAQVDGAIRSAAHFCEYAILGALMRVACQCFGLKGFWLPWLGGVAYAVLDEWHQSYSPGRVSDPMDVLIDACGALCGVLLVNQLMKRWRKKHVYNQ